MINIFTSVVDGNNKIIFQGKTEIRNPDALFEYSKPRQAAAKDKSEEFTSGAIPFFASDLINLIREGEIGQDVDNAAIQVAAVTWIYDSVFRGVSEASFRESELHFKMYPGGEVHYDRLPKGTASNADLYRGRT